MRRIDFEETNYCDALNTNIKGFVPPEIFNILHDNSDIKSIPKNMEYRPDKLSAYYYGDPNMSWIIDFANKFTNGIKDYYAGRKILVPNLDAVQGLL